MKIMESLLWFEYFALTVCDSRVTRGQIPSKPLTIWGNQNDHDDQPEPETRSKRSIFECGSHGQEPTIDSMAAETTLPGEWPWVVGLFSFRDNEFKFICGVSLIDNRFAITNAFCGNRNDGWARKDHYEKAIIVGVGDVSRLTYDEDSTRFLTAIYWHAAYDRIALLVLKEPVTYSKLVKPVCLWDGEDELEMAIKYGTVVGWGYNYEVQTLKAPHRKNMTILPHTTCQDLESHRQYITIRKIFCAVTENATGPNIGGSGLFVEQRGRWMLRGICTYYLPGDKRDIIFFTDIAKYRNWISDTAYRWLQKNSLPLTPTTNYAAGNNLSRTQQCSTRDEIDSLTSGGQSTREGEWPWHVAIYHNEHKGNSSSISYKCGGSLISASHVLTAAHCLMCEQTKRPIAKRSINIYLGTNNIKYFSVGVQIKMVVGWGKDENDQLAEDLMLVEMPVVSDLTCIRSNIFYNKYTNDFTFCAGLHQDTTVCKGDSGGGMVFKLRSGAGKEEWFLRGIVSVRPATDTPCDSSHYVVFTDVAKHLDWIKNSVSLEMSFN